MAWTYVCWARSSSIWEWRNVCSQLLWRTIAHSRMLQNDLSECYCIEEFIINETIELHFVRVGEIAYCVPTRYQLHIVYRHVTNCILCTDTLPIAYCVPIRYQLHIVYRHVTNSTEPYSEQNCNKIILVDLLNCKYLSKDCCLLLMNLEYWYRLLNICQDMHLQPSAQNLEQLLTY